MIMEKVFASPSRYVQGKDVLNAKNVDTLHYFEENVNRKKVFLQLFIECRFRRFDAFVEIPFDLPEGWCWQKISSICEINPKNKLDNTLEISFVMDDGETCREKASKLTGTKWVHIIRKS